jgi:hypothetical protein
MNIAFGYVSVFCQSSISPALLFGKCGCKNWLFDLLWCRAGMCGKAMCQCAFVEISCGRNGAWRVGMRMSAGSPISCRTLRGYCIQRECIFQFGGLGALLRPLGRQGDQVEICPT